MQILRRILVAAVGSAAAVAISLFSYSSAPEDQPVVEPKLTVSAVNAAPVVQAGEARVGNVASAPRPAVALGKANAPKYQWFACDDEVSSASRELDESCAEIPGAMDADITLADEQVGKRVLFSMAVGNGPIVFSAATEAAVSPAPTLSATPTGPAKTIVFASATSTKLNSKVSVTRGLWPAAGTGYVLTYEWLRCSGVAEAALVAPANCSVIVGAVSPSYTVTAKDHGFWLVSHVTASLAGVNSAIWTNSIGPVYKAMK